MTPHAALELESLSDALQMVVARQLAAQRDMSSLARLASRHDCSLLLDAFIGDVDAAPVRAAWLASPRRTPAELERFSTDRRAGVRAAVAGHHRTPPAALERLCSDASRSVRLQVAENPQAPAPARARSWASLAGLNSWQSPTQLRVPGFSVAQAQECLAVAETLTDLTASADNCFPSHSDWDRLTRSMLNEIEIRAIEEADRTPASRDEDLSTAMQISHGAHLLLAGYPQTRDHVEQLLASIGQHAPRSAPQATWWSPLRKLVPLLRTVSAEVSTLELGQRVQQARKADARDLAVAFCTRPVHSAVSIRVLAWHPDVPVQALRLTLRALGWHSLLALNHMNFAGCRAPMLAAIAISGSLGPLAKWLDHSSDPVSFAHALVREGGSRALVSLSREGALSDEVLLAAATRDIAGAHPPVQTRALRLADMALQSSSGALDVFWALQPSYAGTLEDLIRTSLRLATD